MNIHEYQSKQIFKDYGLNTLNGFLIESREDLEKSYDKIKTDIAVLKAQIHAGGRGKAGGVKLVKSIDEARELFDKLYEKNLVTIQTTSEGEKVSKFYLEEACNIQDEYYLSFVLNRKDACISVIASGEGGMDIEDLAKNSPEKILSFNIDPMIGITDYMIRDVLFIFGLDKSYLAEVSKLLKGLYKIYIENDCTLIEINPLIRNDKNELIAIDGKMSFDDNALYRNQKIEAFRDNSNANPNELEAEKHGLSYVGLDGDIGCLVNGAGLAMATMDSIFFAGGTPANFLDIGGGANDEIIAMSLKMVLESEKVKGALVNVFGGINSCDTIARGVVMALDKIDKKIPIVVRLQGTNFKEGKKIIQDSSHEIYLTDSMDAGSEMIVKLTKEAK